MAKFREYRWQIISLCFSSCSTSNWYWLNFIFTPAYRYQEHKFTRSSSTNPSSIDASRWNRLRTSPLKKHRFVSVEYIQRRCVGPLNLTSFTKWMGRCTIISKKDGGKIFSRSHIISLISDYILSTFVLFITLPHMTLKKIPNRINTIETFLGNTFLTTTWSK